MFPFRDGVQTPTTPFLVPQPPALLDRRHGTSELELGVTILSHAIEYLITEQLGGRRPDLHSNRQAVATLCDLSRSLLVVERRVSHREVAAAWLRGCDLVRHRREDREVA